MKNEEMKKYSNYRPLIEKKYQEIIDKSYIKFSAEEINSIREAFLLTEKYHINQVRRSGEPYIFHPLEVARIVSVKLGLGHISIISALLHDIVEDTECTLEEIEEKFGSKVSNIVDGLTKISAFKNNHNDNTSLQADNFRKMILTLSDDIRVVLIKLADRLHNMITMDFMPKDKQIKIASETMYIYAPLAHRLGLYNIKTTLEELSLKYTEPESYREIEEKILKDKSSLEIYINQFTEKINNRLKLEGIECNIKSRIKSIYSIYKKIESQKIPFEDIFDKLAIRIIYKSAKKDEKFIAWKIYSIITDYFIPNPSRLKDWITSPKSNGYESLHITVMGPEAKWVEVQIRSERMDEIAEIGYAAHYKYKNNEDKNNDNYLDDWLASLKETLEDPDKNSVEFIEDFKLSLYSKEIYVFTPKGELISLPRGSVALDYAFSIHTDIGFQYTGAKVNSNIVSINHKLKNGDKIEIFTSKNQTPNKSWLSIVKTSRARTKIKNFLNKEKSNDISYGKELFVRKLKRIGFNISAPNEENTIISKAISFFNKKDGQELFYSISKKYISNQEIKIFYNKVGIPNTLRKNFNNVFSIGRKKQENKTIDKNSKSIVVFGNNEEKLDYNISKCCNPKIGDNIFGFVSSISKSINVHKVGCQNEKNIKENFSYRIIKAKWHFTNRKIKFKINLKISDKNLLSAILKIVEDNNSDIESLNIEKINLNYYNVKIGIVSKNINEKKIIIKKLKLI